MFILSIFQLIFIVVSIYIYIYIFLGKCTVKGKVHLITCHAGTEGSRSIAVVIICPWQ